MVFFLGSHGLDSQFDWSGVLSGCIFKLVKMKCLWLTVFLQWSFPVAAAAFLCVTYSALMGLFYVADRLRNGGLFLLFSVSSFICGLYNSRRNSIVFVLLL